MPPLARKHPIHEKPLSDVILGSAFEPEMILIPAGEFLMGSDPQQDKDAGDVEQPQHRLYLPDYYVAKTPVTNAQYQAFVLAMDHDAPDGWNNRAPPRGNEEHPVVKVSWYDAIAYCQWLSEVTGRSYGLPSEAEWEKAARGTDGRIYPWGNQWDATRCNSAETGMGEITPVWAHPQGASPYGVLDMAGNVWEWTRSLLARSLGELDYRYPYNANDGRENVTLGDKVTCTLRGGTMFFSDRRDVRCACRGGDFPYDRLNDLGFRVVMHP